MLSQFRSQSKQNGLAKLCSSLSVFAVLLKYWSLFITSHYIGIKSCFYKFHVASSSDSDSESSSDDERNTLGAAAGLNHSNFDFDQTTDKLQNLSPTEDMSEKSLNEV